MLTRLRARLARVRKERADDAGVSLIELVVAMSLSTILGTASLLFFVAMNNSAAASLDRSVSTAQVRSALQSWSSYLRVSDGPSAGSPSHRFEWVTSTSMLFYANIDARGTAARMVWLRYDAVTKQLVEEQFAKSGNAYASTPTACRIVASNVTSASFAAYTPSSADTNFGASKAPADPTNPASSVCLSLTGSVSQTDAVANSVLAKITSVSMQLAVADARGHTQTYQTVAAIPSLIGS